MDCKELFFRIFDLKYWIRKWLGVDIAQSPNILLFIRDRKFIVQNTGQITARTISLKLDKSFRDIVEREVNKRKCQARGISFESFCEVPEVRGLFLSEKTLYKEECVLSNLKVRLSEFRKCKIPDEVNQLKENIREKKKEIAKLKKSVKGLKKFLIKGEILHMYDDFIWKMPHIHVSEKGTNDFELSEFHRYIGLEKEIDEFYDNVESEPIRTLSKEQQYDFNIPEPLIKIIGKTKHQWICNVHYFYENGFTKGKEVPITIVISSSTPPKSPPPPPNR